MRVTKTATPHEYEVSGHPIRGYDWKLIRKIGTGTYARIAGSSADGLDEEIVVEEYSDDERRALWDRLGLWQLAVHAHDAILAEIAD